MSVKKGRAKFGGEIYKEMGQKSDLNGTERAWKKNHHVHILPFH